MKTMSDYVSNISRLNALYSALGIKLKSVEDLRVKMLGLRRPEFEAPRGGFVKEADAVKAIFAIRLEILDNEQAILELRVKQQLALDISCAENPVRAVAQIAAEFELNGYIAEYAEQFVDKEVLYRVCYDVETEDYRQINRTVIRDNLTYEHAFQIGKELAETLGLKESYFHGQWMTVMPCAIEETIKVVKS